MAGILEEIISFFEQIFGKKEDQPQPTLPSTPQEALPNEPTPDTGTTQPAPVTLTPLSPLDPVATQPTETTMPPVISSPEQGGVVVPEINSPSQPDTTTAAPVANQQYCTIQDLARNPDGSVYKDANGWVHPTGTTTTYKMNPSITNADVMQKSSTLSPTDYAAWVQANGTRI